MGSAVAWVATVALAPSASAVTPPIASRNPSNVTADALPTVQIDGVAWSQVVVGNTVYVGGNFANARPAGAAAGTSLTPRANLLSYNVTTGALITTFAPTLNGEVKAVAASPDGSRIYVGGAFTTANGTTRSRIAAYSTATGALITTFKPAMGTQVNAIVATNTTVYAGGVFTTAAGVARNRLAAFNAADGSLTAWNPNADSTVNALVITPDGSRVIVGGAFRNVGGQSAIGLASTDATTGAVMPWAANQVVRDAYNANTKAINSAIESLSTDGTSVYGTGYVFGGSSDGNLEGTFSADPNSGTINWVESCHGDTYSSYTLGGLVYVVGHVHFCGDVGGYPQTDTPWAMQRAIAFTTQATGTLLHDNFGGSYKDWFGTPSPSLANWFPSLVNGTFTGQGQAAWNVSGNSQYVVLGGEFPQVNGKAQQGLTRFAVPAVSPNHDGPRLATTKFVPNLLATSNSSVRVGFQANWDRDDQTLTYKVYRNGGTTPIWTSTVDSQFWNRPMLGFTDTGLTPGATYSYSVTATDPVGVNAVGSPVSITMPAANPAQYAYGAQVIADGATQYWPGDETSGSVLNDRVGYDDAITTATGVTRGVSGPLTGDTGTKYDGSTGASIQEATPVYGPTAFSVEAWFQTTTNRGGQIVGFGSAQTGLSQNNDRKIYMDNTGHIYFGVASNRTVHTSGTYNNGVWHHVVATTNGSTMTLYLDGNPVPTGGSQAAQTLYPGSWRIGGDKLSGFTGASTSPYFAGNIGQVAIYPTVLTGAKISAHYAARLSTNTPPTATFTQTCTDLACNFDSTGSQDPDGSIASYAWTFGDGATSTDANPSHTYAAGGDYQVKLTVTDNQGLPGSFTQPLTVVGPNQLPTASFTNNCTDLACNFDGTGSTDPDGTIASYAWTFGDGGTSTSAAPSHTFTTAGDKTVELTVTDNRGGTNTSSQQITVTPPNQLPTASFTKNCTNLACTFDSSGSSDSDGTIASYAWTFGDGGTSTDASPSHTYAAGGTYPVTLTVIDNRGGINTASQPLTVAAANQLPTASFTQNCTNLVCAFNGLGSSDPDGTIASYAWTFGDGGTSTLAQPSHTYAAAGTYSVTLTVTDNASGTGNTTQPVTVTAATVTNYATDLFGRTATSAWGPADVGGLWSVSGTAANYTVGSGTGQMKIPTAGGQPAAYLNTLALSDTNTVADFTIDKPATGGGYYEYLTARHKGTSDYRLRAKILSTGVVQVSLTKMVSGTETVLSTQTVTGVTFVPGTALRMRLQVSGTSTVTLTGKLWVASGTEPTAWRVSATDATSPLPAGAPGVITYLSGTATNAPATITWDNFSVSAIGP